MRFYYDALVISLLLPFAVGAGCVILAPLFSRLRAAPLGHALVALSPALVLLLAVHLLGWLRYPPTLTHERLPYLGIAAACAYALIAWFPSTGWWAWFVPLQVGVAASWLLLPHWSFPLFLLERPFWFLLFPQIVLLVWTIWVKTGEASKGAGPLLPMLVWGAAVVGLLVLSANARFAQMACMISAAQAGAALPAISRVFRSHWYHTAPAASFLHSSLLLQGYLFSRGWQEHGPHEVPRLCFLFVFLSPLAAALVELPGLNRLRPVPKRLLQTLLLAVVAGAGLVLAHVLPEPLPEGGEWN